MDVPDFADNVCEIGASRGRLSPDRDPQLTAERGNDLDASLYLAYREIPQAALAPAGGLPGAKKMQTPSALSMAMTIVVGERTLVAEIERTLQRFDARHRASQRRARPPRR